MRFWHLAQNRSSNRLNISNLGIFKRILRSFQSKKLWVLLWNIVLAIFFLSIAIFAFLSTINDKYEYANIANIVYSIVFIIKFLTYLVKVVFVILGFVNPFGESFFKLKGAWSLVGEGAYLLLLLYFVYVLYCFTVHLK